MVDPGPPPVPFAGAVLTGGSSRRMGIDKALIQVDGRALARRVADALATAGAEPVVAIGGDAAALTACGLTVVADAFPGAGPLGGVLTALDALRDAAVVAVLACDLTDPDPAAVRAVVAAAARPGVDVAVPVVGGRLQYHHAAWRRAAREPLHTAFASGERALHRAAAALTVAQVRSIDARAVRDADTPDDLPR